jgi:hypothetical protein
LGHRPDSGDEFLLAPIHPPPLVAFSGPSILQATIGGAAADFRPKQISNRLFSFVVASRDVVFHIYKLKSFVVYEQYMVFFHLWGNGGPHWTLEYQNFFRKKTVNGPHFLNLEVKINTLMRMW